MKPATKEWVEKAEGDFRTTGRELRARKFPNFDASCFHAQQCAEKYLKVRLQEAGIQFAKTHNLIVLLDLALAAEPLWEEFRPMLTRLNAFAVEFRYPGDIADKPTAKEALRFCSIIRERARSRLGLKP